jgi:DNA polymerase/3'-5' exonuclease PolX
MGDDVTCLVLGNTDGEIAKVLEAITEQLEERDDNPYRVQAFRHGAERVRTTETPLTEMVEQGGGQALTQLEGIGQGLANTIFEFISTGRSTFIKCRSSFLTHPFSRKAATGMIRLDGVINRLA